MKKIPLSQGYFALVDDDDFDFLMQWGWHFFKNALGSGYAARHEGARKTKSHAASSTTFLMHRVIMKTPDGFETDHRDGDKLNNQKYNLRICTKRQNRQHFRKKSVGKSSIYRGVYWEKRRSLWCSQITINDKKIHLGYHTEENMAALAYNESALEHFGEFAHLNKISS